MPAYSNPQGTNAYIMNMYTRPEYRRRGIASKTLDLLVQEAKKTRYQKNIFRRHRDGKTCICKIRICWHERRNGISVMIPVKFI
jgi:GNAT superfamily N-acetyltransferase